MVEVWEDIKRLNGKFKISNKGRIKNKKTNYVLKQNINKYGYCRVRLSIGKVKVTLMIHRAVAMAFIPNPNNKKTVNHINGVKTDNNIDNLEWCSQKENVRHAWDIGLATLDGLKIPVIMYSLDGKELETFESTREAGRKFKIGNSHISACCKGQRKTAGGYKWKYYNKKENRK